MMLSRHLELEVARHRMLKLSTKGHQMSMIFKYHYLTSHLLRICFVTGGWEGPGSWSVHGFTELRGT